MKSSKGDDSSITIGDKGVSNVMVRLRQKNKSRTEVVSKKELILSLLTETHTLR